MVQSALSLGAELAMPASFTGATSHRRRGHRDLHARRAAVECTARVLVNAAGPGPRTSRAPSNPAIPIPDVDLVQGTHIVLPFAVTAGIYYVESPTDGRAVFVMPWHGATLIGTTETPYRGAPDKVHPLPEEEEYLLAVARHYFPAFRHLTREHITQRFAGLRVLPAATQAAFDRSRETIFTTDREPKAARARHLRRQTHRLARRRRARLGAHQHVLAGTPQASRNGSIDFEETYMIKNGMAVLTLALIATLAHADDYLSPTNERVRLSLGFMHLSSTTDIRLDSSGGVPGTPINAESDLGLDHVGLRTQISGHGAGRRAAPAALRLLLPWIEPVTPPSPRRSYFATWSCSPAILCRPT